jgi:hypothetical protein
MKREWWKSKETIDDEQFYFIGPSKFQKIQFYD